MSLQNREKLTPLPLVRKMSALAQSPLSVWTHQKFRKIESFCAKSAESASEDPPVRTGRTPLSPDCGRLLCTAPLSDKASNSTCRHKGVLNLNFRPFSFANLYLNRLLTSLYDL